MVVITDCGECFFHNPLWQHCIFKYVSHTGGTLLLLSTHLIKVRSGHTRVIECKRETKWTSEMREREIRATGSRGNGRFGINRRKDVVEISAPWVLSIKFFPRPPIPMISDSSSLSLPSLCLPSPTVPETQPCDSRGKKVVFVQSPNAKGMYH